MASRGLSPWATSPTPWPCATAVLGPRRCLWRAGRTCRRRTISWRSWPWTRRAPSPSGEVRGCRTTTRPRGYGGSPQAPGPPPPAAPPRAAAGSCSPPPGTASASGAPAASCGGCCGTRRTPEAFAAPSPPSTSTPRRGRLLCSRRATSTVPARCGTWRRGRRGSGPSTSGKRCSTSPSAPTGSSRPWASGATASWWTRGSRRTWA
mmetsp:Transcript_96954/g.263344  ORF Transcript_96954/g.263344 Transcript_96954/m.263344 type:complete len:206 (-) Transcript_96954:291-908(-)